MVSAFLCCYGKEFTGKQDWRDDLIGGGESGKVLRLLFTLIK